MANGCVLFQGIHSEGSAIRTLIGILFLDIIYTLPAADLLIDVFQTEPLDFHSDAFYKSRQSQIDERMSQMNSEEVRHILIDEIESLEYHTSL